MTKYLFEANYVGDGIKGLMREGGTKRRDAVGGPQIGGRLARQLLLRLWGHRRPGRLRYPRQANAAALSLMINSTGAVNLRLKPLMTPEDIDEAAKKTPSYRAPGQ